MDGMKVMRDGVIAHDEDRRLFCHFEQEQQGEAPPRQIHRRGPPSRDTVGTLGMGPSE
ncbi:hypothetical protein [Mesorhizobium sp. SARCC-RB16n]|uniref:hypothetical protein n=1 Tax=Mesorhizobium sp. SARCC-RB16n TaxID=2116687 RepID=UPI00166E3D34|nr:hypothetical protein [Mesorhizobium sp. SARCC-RB16n]